MNRRVVRYRFVIEPAQGRTHLEPHRTTAGKQVALLVPSQGLNRAAHSREARIFLMFGQISFTLFLWVPRLGAPTVGQQQT